MPAYPTQSASLASRQIDAALVNIRQRCNEAIGNMASGTVTSEYVLNLHAELKSTGAQIVALETTPGLVDFVRNEKGDGSLDVVAAYNAVKTAGGDCLAWIENNFPKDGSGWLSHVKFSGSSLTFNAFTPAQTATLRSVLQTVVDAIAL